MPNPILVNDEERGRAAGRRRRDGRRFAPKIDRDDSTSVPMRRAATTARRPQHAARAGLPVGMLLLVGLGASLPGAYAQGNRSRADADLVPDTRAESRAPDEALNGGAQDRAVLEALYRATGGANWTNSANWLTDAPLDGWYGVETNHDGRVTGLDLKGNRLTGGIPGELGGLPDLEDLFLCCNQLTGEIPTELGGLSNLERLSLDGNQLTGALPAELGGLSNLEGLYLHVNQLTGAIPAELGGLSNLEDLFLGLNQLTGEIPGELGRLVSLNRLRLDGNQLTGAVPRDLMHLPRLTLLDINRTRVCLPVDSAFRAWVSGLAGFRSSGLDCASCSFPSRGHGTR